MEWYRPDIVHLPGMRSPDVSLADRSAFIPYWLIPTLWGAAAILPTILMRRTLSA